MRKCASRRLIARRRILLKPIHLKLESIPDIVLVRFVPHKFYKEKKIEPVLIDIDRVIIMERLNTPTKVIVYTYNTKDNH